MSTLLFEHHSSRLFWCLTSRRPILSLVRRLVDISFYGWLSTCYFCSAGPCWLPLAVGRIALMIYSHIITQCFAMKLVVGCVNWCSSPRSQFQTSINFWAAPSLTEYRLSNVVGWVLSCNEIVPCTSFVRRCFALPSYATAFRYPVDLWFLIADVTPRWSRVLQWY